MVKFKNIGALLACTISLMLTGCEEQMASIPLDTPSEECTSVTDILTEVDPITTTTTTTSVTATQPAVVPAPLSDTELMELSDAVVRSLVTCILSNDISPLSSGEIFATYLTDTRKSGKYLYEHLAFDTEDIFYVADGDNRTVVHCYQRGALADLLSAEDYLSAFISYFEKYTECTIADSLCITDNPHPADMQVYLTGCAYKDEFIISVSTYKPSIAEARNLTKEVVLWQDI